MTKKIFVFLLLMLIFILMGCITTPTSDTNTDLNNKNQSDINISDDNLINNGNTIDNNKKIDISDINLKNVNIKPTNTSDVNYVANFRLFKINFPKCIVSCNKELPNFVECASNCFIDSSPNNFEKLTNSEKTRYTGQCRTDCFSYAKSSTNCSKICELN
jgi:hypothetical protein